MLSIEDDRSMKPLLQGGFSQADPQISPDGRWLAYSSSESGHFELYVRPIPKVDSGKWQVSTSGGQQGKWSPNGRELFYRNGDAMMAVSVETGSTFKAGVPETLFRKTNYSPGIMSRDLSPDGKRFLMIKPGESGEKMSTAAGPGKSISS